MSAALVFDLDGTLIDSIDFIARSFVEAGKTLGIYVDYDLVKEYVGYPLDDLVQRILPGLSEAALREFLRVRREYVERNWRLQVKPYPDVVPALERLRARGYKLAVASSSRAERIAEFLDYFGLSKYFEVMIGAGNGVKGKPHPDVILLALKAMGVPRDMAYYVGDREVDCVAAREAGVRFIYVNREGRGLRGCAPYLTITSLVELAGLDL